MSNSVEHRKDGFIGQRMTYVPGIVKKKILNDARVNDLYITHIGMFPKAFGHRRDRPFGSSQFILLYCVDGEGWVEMNGRKSVISKDEMFIISPKTKCSYGASDKKPWTNYWIHFTGENALAYSPQINKIISIPPNENNRIEERIILFEEMLQNMEDHFNFEKVVYANICLKHFLASVKFLPVYRSVKKEPDNDLLNKVVSFMKTNLHRNLNMSDLANFCDCSVSNVYKIFRRNYESSPIDFFIHLKMEKASRYLLRTNWQIKEIARKMGYDDPYYFSRIFKIHVGQSPANFRKEEK